MPTGNSRSRRVKVNCDEIDTSPVTFRDTAGIDIGAERHYVSVPEDRDKQPIRTFACFTPDLTAMAQWLKACRIRHIVMESTGVYWIPVYEILTQAGFDVKLVDARHARNVPGRKSDVMDCAWLRKLHTHGFLRACFLPPPHVEQMRCYWRHRATLLASATQHTQRMHKSLEQMNIQLHKVVSDVTGVTGMLIIRDIIAGERDPHKLILHRQHGLKHTEEMFIKALTGNYRPEHLFTLKQAVETYDFIISQITECDVQLQACMSAIEDAPPRDGGHPTAPTPTSKPAPGARSKNAPKFDIVRELVRITGVDLTRINGINSQTFQTCVSELGTDLLRFPTEAQFCSWLGACPNHEITGGKVKKRRTRHVANRVMQALRTAAQSLHNSGSALGAYYRRMRARLGAPKANVATAHKLARLIWRIMTYGHEYVDIGQQSYEQQLAKKAQESLKRQARRLGYTLIDNKTGEVHRPVPA